MPEVDTKEQVAVKEPEGEKGAVEPVVSPKEEMIPKARFQEGMSLLQRQAAVHETAARTAEERLTAVEAEKVDLQAQLKTLREDLQTALEAEDEVGQKKATAHIADRLDKLSKREAKAEADLRHAAEVARSSKAEALEAKAEMFALKTGMKKEDLLKLGNTAAMEIAALQYQLNALTTQTQESSKKTGVGLRRPGEFDSEQSSVSGGAEESWKKYSKGQSVSSAERAAALAYGRGKGYT